MHILSSASWVVQNLTVHCDWAYQTFTVEIFLLGLKYFSSQLQLFFKSFINANVIAAFADVSCVRFVHDRSIKAVKKTISLSTKEEDLSFGSLSAAAAS